MKALKTLLFSLALCFTLQSANAQCNGCAFFSLNDTLLCINGTPISPDSILTPGGQFSINTIDLTINPQTGLISGSGAASGQYIVTYQAPAPCNQSCSITITVSNQQAQFFYPNPVMCIPGVPSTPVTATFPSGTFSAIPTGLSIDPNDGTIDINSSVPGTYSITHTIPNGCNATFNGDVTIAQSDTNAILDYPQEVYCPTDSIAVPVLVSDSMGFFPGISGLVFADASGTIALQNTQPGIYEVRYEIAGVCPLTLADTIEVLPITDPAFSYSSLSYCSNDPNPIPTATNPGGTYTMFDVNRDTLPFIDTQTGELMLDSMNIASSPYTICFTPNSSCTVTSCEEVLVEDVIDPIIEVVGNMLQVNNVAGNFTWFLNGQMIGGNTNSIGFTGVGTYSVDFSTSSSNCTTSDTLLLTGREEAELGDHQAFLMPNPGRGEVDLFVDLENGVRYDLEVRNPLGQLILLEEELRSGQKTLHLEELANGLYLFHIRSDIGVKSIRYLKQ